VVASAHRLAGGKPIIVSPVTLKPRHNPYASGAVLPTPFGQLPPQVDPRQLSLFAAGWTLGSIRSMAVGGVKAITYYETTGWRGLMETETGSQLPDKFPSVPGMVFPLYHVLADIADFRGADVLTATTTDELKIRCLLLQQKEHTCLMVANLTPEPQTVELVGVPSFRTVSGLDENTVCRATNEPETYRAQDAFAFQGNTLTLLPYAVARLDS
jgi:D-apionolactonase